MRKGMTLVEILAVLLVLPFAVMALDALFHTMLSDFPRSLGLVQENATLLNMLERVHQDVSVAKGLPTSFGQHTTNDEVLLIELADGTFCYQLEQGKLIRRNLSLDQENDGADTIVWSLPNSVVQWRVWRKGEKGYAVEVNAYMRHKLRTKYQKKMANSRVYFLGTI
jgi:prepilin-type N-terminal cleavage/methylation domain-containing protein